MLRRFRAPMIMMPEMAFVKLIKGECKVGVIFEMEK